MDMSELGRADLLQGQLRRDEPMHRHTSWRVGGPAQWAYFPADLDDLCCFLAQQDRRQPVYLLGLGSNLLVRDGGVRATVIFTHPALSVLGAVEERPEGVRIYAQAGVASPKLARFSANQGARGGEFLAGIPGTVGGALAMNAGCYGGETWAVVNRVHTVGRTGTLRERAPQEYRTGYRQVELLEGGEEWFVGAWFDFPRGDGVAGRELIRDLLARRVASQPLGQPNAGSVFRNPQGDHAARLIEAAGLKGRRIGGAQISPKHANFIVNCGGARAADIEELIVVAEQTVAARFGVHLHREVRIIGAPL